MKRLAMVTTACAAVALGIDFQRLQRERRRRNHQRHRQV